MSIAHRLAAFGPALRTIVRQYWRDLLSVYYANTPVWRWLKSGTLVVFGLFCWTGASVLLSYRSDWGLLTYVMAYGFLLLVWGPLTHFVVVPLAIRLRRTAEHSIVRTAAQQASKINLSVFLLLVLAFGTMTPGVMMFEYSNPFTGGESADASADVICEYDTETVSCHLENVEGVDSVVVQSGEETVATATEPPYAFEIDRKNLAEVRTGAQFVVELRDEDGETLRRYVQTVPS